MKYFLRVISILTLLTTFVFLSQGFLHNTLHTVGKKWFVEWRTVQDTYFVGRLVQSRQAGVFSYAGFFGHGDVSLFSDQAELVRHQYDTYINQGEFSEFNSYDSAIDLQGMIFSLFDQETSLSPELNLMLFQGITSLLSAGSLVLIIIWFYKELGLLSAVFAAIFMLLSEWLTLFGGVVYWSLWAFYLPLIVILFHLQKKSLAVPSIKTLTFLVYSTILIKCLFNGFNYITTTLVMAFCPLVYFGLAAGWNKRDAISIFICTLAAEFLAVISALCILIYQNTVVLGGLDKGFEYIIYSLKKRSIGDPNNFSGALAESLNAKYLPVLKEYITGRAIYLDTTFLSTHIPGFTLKHIEISYIWIFGILLAATLIFLLFKNRMGKGRKLSAFVITTWLSVLAPLSWFIIFKAHSYLHPHLNFIIWQMPFTLFVFAMCGAVIQNIFGRSSVK
jgi:hypothetical protein